MSLKISQPHGHVQSSIINVVLNYSMQNSESAKAGDTHAEGSVGSKTGLATNHLLRNLDTHKSKV